MGTMRKEGLSTDMTLDPCQFSLGRTFKKLICMLELQEDYKIL
jgi:hypothetical protein